MPKKRPVNPLKTPEYYRLQDPAMAAIAAEMITEGKASGVTLKGTNEPVCEVSRVHVAEFDHRVRAYRAAQARIAI